MSSNALDFLNIFIRTPGDLLYFLAVFALGQVVLFMSLGQRLRKQTIHAPRQYLIAAVGIVIVWSIIVVGALFTLLSGQTADILLPPMERAAQVMTLLLLGWAFFTADYAIGTRRSNTILLAACSLVIIGYVITGVDWVGLYPTTEFNQTQYSLTWTLATALVSGLYILLYILFFRYVADAPLKMVLFAVAAIGAVGTLLQLGNGELSGHYAGLMRIAFLVSFLLALVVIYRMIVSQFEAEIEMTAITPAPLQAGVAEDAGAVQTFVPPVNPTTSEKDSAQLMRALGLMIEGATPENIPDRMVEATITTLKVDVGVLLRVPDANYADVVTGFDHVLNRKITSISINLDEQPTLQNAIERRLQRPLFPDRNIDELHDLYARLDIEPTGPTYFQPLVEGRQLLGVLLVGLPYTGRELNEPDQELLKGIGIIGSSLLGLSNAARDAKMQAESRVIQAMVQGVSPEQVDDNSALNAWQELNNELTASREQINQLMKQVASLRIQLDDEQSRLAHTLGDTEEGKTVSQQIVTLNDEYQHILEERDQLAKRLREAEAALTSAVTDDRSSVLKAMIEALRGEKNELESHRDRLQSQLDGLRQTTAVTADVSQLLDKLSMDTAQTTLERDALLGKLQDIEGQLGAIGLESGLTGITRWVMQVYEQRANLQERLDNLRDERAVLRSELDRYTDLIAREDEREKQVQNLQSEVVHLASDREAAIKQRDKLRAERDELQARQEALREQQARLMAELAGFEQELLESHEEQQQLRNEIQMLTRERSQVQMERDRLAAEEKSLVTQRDQLLARADGDRERLQQIGVDGVGALSQMIADITAQRDALEKELAESRNQMAALEDRLEVLQIRATAFQGQTVYRPDNPEVMISLVQDLRTPMTSIVGYVDLVLNESAGILGEMQRKFMQRVASNVNRLAYMLDDLIQISFLDAGRFSLTAEPIDAIEIIDDAISSATPQLREKGINLHLDLDDDVPFVRADRDALVQIIGQLLTNAYLASPVGGEIFINARKSKHPLRNKEKGKNLPSSVLWVTFEDRGGGITPEDVPRVFARKYRAENPLIEGLGDTGVGLAIAKALVEAQGGQIWLDTRERVGTALNFVLPLEDETVAEASKHATP